MNLPVDPKRTGVKATKITWTDPPMFVADSRWYGPFGAILLRDGASFVLCCPGCGQAGSGRDDARWAVTAGSWDDVTTLSLSPSIAKSCCGWHGYLKNGVFESC